MIVETHPQSRIAGGLFDIAVGKLGAVEASRFMFSRHDDLGTSPIEALKAGRNDAVRRVILRLLERSK